MTAGPTVTVAVPVLDEAAHLDACLDAIERQTYPGIVEVLVVDGGSRDRTVEIARARPHVRVLENPDRVQSAAMNVALAEAQGDVLVRADGHSVLADDYVERCVAALKATGAVMVGGAWVMDPQTWVQRVAAAAMTSPIGYSSARFNPDRPAGPADSVSFGAYAVADARAVGGYDAALVVNEDAEFAYRMGRRGAVWFDPAIRFTYVPRSDLVGLARQFFRYGRGRAATARRHPGSLALRHLAAPLLVLGLLSPWRRRVAVAYGLVVTAAVVGQARTDPRSAVGLYLALPLMHVAWGSGFLLGLVGGVPGRHGR